MQPANPSVLSLFYTPRHAYGDVFDQMRARVTLMFSAFVLVGSVLAILGAVLVRNQAADFTSTLLISALAIGILPQFVVVTLVHTGRLRAATFIALAVWALSSIIALLQDGVASNYMLTLVLPLLYASLIWQWRGTILVIIAESVGVIGVAYLQSTGSLPALALPADEVSSHVLLDLLLLLAGGFLCGSAAYELRRSLRYTSRLVAQLRATSEVAQRTATFIDLNELLKQTVSFIRDRFGFYNVQIFLMDAEQRFATLQASTGDAGDALLQRGYRLAVGSQSTIGRVTLLGEPVVIGVEPQADGTPPSDEFLPGTRSVLALPLIARDQIIGVLDIQSTRPDAFSQEDVESLGIMASHLSIAINNAQLFQDQRMALNENRRMFLEAQTNLREIQLLNQRLTGEAWNDYLRSRSADVVGYTLSNNQLRHDEEWTPILEQAASRRQPVITTVGDRQMVAVPVELRGRSIGAIEVETSSTARQSDTLEMLQSVAQRLALSIDNARLFEQAQELAQQELEVNAISAKLQGMTSMNDIVKTAVSELGRALGAQQASIRLGLDLGKRLPSGTNGTSGISGASGTSGTGMIAPGQREARSNQ